MKGLDSHQMLTIFHSKCDLIFWN